MFAEIAILAIVHATTIYLLWFGGRIVRTAMRTGRLQARGAIYNRDDQPILFYGLTASWFGFFALMLLASALLVYRVLSQ